MATQPNWHGPAAYPIPLPPTLAYIMGAPAAPRSAVELLIERAIDELDLLDGNPDAEEVDVEDSFALSPMAQHFADKHAGCPIADPGGCEHDGREEGY
jgi:hypothetical protein